VVSSLTTLVSFSPANTMTNIAIIGAGIGGISTAIFLRKFGFKCTVFEQAPEFLRLGAGINFAPNGTRIFRAMGLGDEMLRVGVKPRLRSNRRWDTGEPFFSSDNIANAKKYGSEYVAFHRADLHNMLVGAVGRETFQLGKRLTRLLAKDSSVELHFSDGTILSFDAVVGADGLNSIVRQYTTGLDDSQYFGHAAYRAIVPTEKLKGKIDLCDYIRWWGPNESYVLTYCMKEDRAEYNVVASGPETLQSTDLKPMPVPAKDMKATFNGFHADAQLVLENCEDVSRWPMIVRTPKRPWSKGRVAILGDAAHPMTPHLGQGGGMAVEDAVILARCLQAVDGKDIERAFQSYEACRFERASEVQFASQENKIGRGDRDPSWLFSYDATSVPIGM
jgi:6-hydroxynicotinate 3-monooxygenase